MKPYGYVRKDGEGLFIYGEHQFQNAMGAELVPVYLHPKEWVGLTDEEVQDCIKTADYNQGQYKRTLYWAHLAAAIEQALKEKNT